MLAHAVWLAQSSEQLPCRSAEVKFFSPFFSAKDVVKFGVKFSVLRFPGFGCATEHFTKFHARNGVRNGQFHANFTLPGRSADNPNPNHSATNTICPETITELIRFELLRCKNYVTAPEINCPRGPKSPEITVRKSFKSPVRITAPKNNSKTISVM